MSAEEIRRDFAKAWGEIGAAWGIAPSTAAVQGYLLAHGGPLTEPEVRRTLGLSHRAASVALAQCEEWGVIDRAPAPRRSGQRGPAAVAYVMNGDHWEWFRRVSAARKERETDPVLPVLDRCVAAARAGAGTGDGSGRDELAALARRLDELRGFVYLFDRGVGAFVEARPRATEHLFRMLGELDDATIARLFQLAGELDPAEMARGLRALSGLSPAATRRLLALAARPQIGRLLGAR